MVIYLCIFEKNYADININDDHVPFFAVPWPHRPAAVSAEAYTEARAVVGGVKLGNQHVYMHKCAQR